METMGAAILCGGKSRRMGASKAKLTLGGISLAARKARQVRAAAQILLCVSDQLELCIPGCEVITDRYAGCGPMAGIHAALRACKTDGLFVVACDMPFADWQAAEALYDRWSGGADVIVPISPDGRREFTCGLYRTRCAKQLEALLNAGRYRLRDMAEVLRVQTVPASELGLSPMALMNVNTPEDWRQAQALFSE